MAKESKSSTKKQQGTSTGSSQPPWLNTALIAGIALYTFFLFLESINHEFLTWDDPYYITQNPLIKDFSWQGVWNIMTTPVLGMYNPIPFLLYMVEYKLWEFDPRPYNFISILLHLTATVMVYRFIFRLSKRWETAFIVAFLFAIHPMHVSVVVWASQIKTSIYLIFYFWALNLYLRYTEDNFKWKYIAYICILFVLSALSKPSAVTMAPMLFLLDYYRGRKFEWRIILEKLPLFTLALGFGLLTLFTHGEEGDSIFEVGQTYSLLNNFLVSNYSIAFYIEKLFYPLNLSTIYPYPEANPYLPLRYYLMIPIIPVIAFLVWKAGKFRKELIFGILFFCVAISVMLRIVPSGFFGTANRYSYLSYTGLFYIMGQFYVYVKDKRIDFKINLVPYLNVLLVIYFIFCTYRTTIRIDVWENSVSLFTDVIKKAPKLTIAYSHRATAKSYKGDIYGAIQDLELALEIDSTYAEAYNNRSVFRDALKDYTGALADAEKAIALNKDYVDAYVNRASVLSHMGRLEESLEGYNKAVTMRSDGGSIYFNRGLVRMALQDSTGAMQDWIKADKLGVEQAEQYITHYSQPASAPF